MKPKIIIVPPPILPIPDVKGGAVERLITMICEDNEIQQRLDLTVCSIYDDKAINAQKKYANTRFVNIKPTTNEFVRKWGGKLSWHLRNKLDIDFLYHDHYYNTINNIIKKSNPGFDLVIAEGSCFPQLRSASKQMGRNRFVAHLHGGYQATAQSEEIYGNIIAVSNYICNNYTKTSRIVPNRAIVVFNGINTDSLLRTIQAKDKDDIRASLGFAKDDFILLYCGRIVPQKGVKELIEALLKINNDKVKLLIMGSSDFALGDFGYYPKMVKNLIQQHRDRIVFTGFIPNDEIYRYHQIADIGVIPSTYNDPCPLSMCELISSGLPTIATAAGGMTEIGTPETTLFVSIDNIEEDLIIAINKLYNNADLRMKMHQAALERREYFHRNRFYTDFCAAIDKLCKLNKM